ncbi:hypothetical protein BS028_08400 [Vibrio parahaemolyticus]|nr:hypothetical protein [Vibrio parahaemolyticus]
MKINAIAILSTIVFSSFALAMDDNQGSINESEKAKYHHNTYTQISEKISFGCDINFEESGDLNKEIAIRIRNTDFIALPNSNMTAKVSFNDSNKNTINGISTTATEVKFKHSFKYDTDTEQRVVFKGLLASETAKFEVFDEENALVFTEFVDLSKSKQRILKVANLCAPASNEP